MAGRLEELEREPDLLVGVDVRGDVRPYGLAEPDEQEVDDVAVGVDVAALSLFGGFPDVGAVLAARSVRPGAAAHGAARRLLGLRATIACSQANPLRELVTASGG